MGRSHPATLAARTLVTAGFVASIAAATIGAESAQQAFARDWTGSRVVVRQPLYTLVYDERGRFAKMYRGKRAGLTVVTPFMGTYYQFDGHSSEVDIVDQDPQRIINAVRDTYRRSLVLDEGAFQKIDPVLIVRYEPGVELIVKNVRVERERVRLAFVRTAVDGNDTSEIATTLTVQWPVPLSSSLSERDKLEALIRRFVDLPEGQP